MSDPSLELLNALAPVLASAAAVVGGLVALVKGAPKIRRVFGATDQTKTIIRLREQLDETQELADLRAEMIVELKSERDDDKSDHAVEVLRLNGDLDFARRTADDLRRRLSAKLGENAP